MTGPAVSVVIPAHEAAATIGETLEAIAAQDIDRPYEVIVVDDGSRDQTAEAAAAAPGPVRVVRKQRSGAGAARNLGVEHASAPVIAFTDSDCLPTARWLRAGLAALAGADLVQGAVGADPRHPPGPFDRTLYVTEESGLYETANLFVERDLFERLGGFEDWIEEGMARPFGEDVWLGWRARRAGASTAFAPEALVHHMVFLRSAPAYVAERARLKDFPAMTARMPELRDHYCYRRWFLSDRSAALDAALLGVGAAAASALVLAPSAAIVPLLATLPYARINLRRAWRWRSRAPFVVAGDLAADVVGLLALGVGSVRWRSLVL